MFKIRYHFLISFCLILFSGCEKEVVLEFNDYQQSLAVFSLFTPNNVLTDDTSFIVEITSTQSILDNSALEFIDDAEVTVVTTANDDLVGSGSVEDRLTTEIDSDDRLIYKTNEIVLKDGFEYELIVDHPDFPSVSATSFVPPVTEITNIDFDAFKQSQENQLPGFTKFFTNVSMDIPNNSNQDDFFHLLVWLRFDNVWSAVNNRFETRWTPVNIGRETLQEHLGTEDAIVVNVNESPVFFGAHFGDERFENSSQKINFDISFLLFDSDNPSEIKVELRSVSKDYHRYFVDGFRLSQAGNNSFFVNSNNITNNIEGGFGVFAGYTAFDVDMSFRK